MRARIPALALVFALLADAAAARIKIDRYEPDTLPRVRLWVTMLDNTRPVPPDSVISWAVFANDELLKDEPEVRTAAELDRPMAVAAVLDARFSETWRLAREGMQRALADLPEGSLAFGIATHEGTSRMPQEGWSTQAADLPASLEQVPASGKGPRLYRAVKQALESFPLAPGLAPEPSDGELPPPPKEDDPPFPTDRVLYVVGDGEIETERGGATVSERLRELVYLARRRGVRVMTIGVTQTAEQTNHLRVLEVLARKTRGTYRRAHHSTELPEVMAEAAAELAGRIVIDAEVPDLRPGDAVTFKVRARMHGGVSETTREYTARVENVMSWWDRLMDQVADTWERWPWWARSLVILGVSLVVALIVLIIVVRKARKARRARQAAAEARAAALAARKPCTVCGRMMMPDWTDCLFCAQTQETPKRFRLTGRSGLWAGHAVRFDKELVTIGSAPHCDVQVPDRGVAPEHCGLRDRGGAEFILTDFNTDTGTWVNGERITQVVIGEGDTIRIGETEFVFGIEAESEHA